MEPKKQHVFISWFPNWYIHHGSRYIHHGLRYIHHGLPGSTHHGSKKRQKTMMCWTKLFFQIFPNFFPNYIHHGSRYIHHSSIHHGSIHHGSRYIHHSSQKPPVFLNHGSYEVYIMVLYVVGNHDIWYEILLYNMVSKKKWLFYHTYDYHTIRPNSHLIFFVGNYDIWYEILLYIMVSKKNDYSTIHHGFWLCQN